MAPCDFRLFRFIAKFITMFTSSIISIFFFVVAPIASFQHPVAIHHLPYVAANIHCTAHLKHNRFPSTALHLSPSLCDSAMALSAVTLSSSIGFVSDKMNLFGGSAGIIVTLLSAGMLSNIDIFGLSIPSEHKIYGERSNRRVHSFVAYHEITSTSHLLI